MATKEEWEKEWTRRSEDERVKQKEEWVGTEYGWSQQRRQPRECQEPLEDEEMLGGSYRCLRLSKKEVRGEYPNSEGMAKEVHPAATMGTIGGRCSIEAEKHLTKEDCRAMDLLVEKNSTRELAWRSMM